MGCPDYFRASISTSTISDLVSPSQILITALSLLYTSTIFLLLLLLSLSATEMYVTFTTYKWTVRVWTVPQNPVSSLSCKCDEDKAKDPSQDILRG